MSKLIAVVLLAVAGVSMVTCQDHRAEKVVPAQGFISPAYEKINAWIEESHPEQQSSAKDFKLVKEHLNNEAASIPAEDRASWEQFAALDDVLDNKCTSESEALIAQNMEAAGLHGDDEAEELNRVQLAVRQMNFIHNFACAVHKGAQDRPKVKAEVPEYMQEQFYKRYPDGLYV